MADKVLFQLYFTEGEKKGQKAEVMDVDAKHWDALVATIKETYSAKGVLSYLEQDLPIHLTRDTFLATEGEMREVNLEALSEDAYIAHFSLDVFIRQLDELAVADVMFERG